MTRRESWLHDEVAVMKKKWWLALAALIVIALLVAIGVPLLLPPTPGVTYANYSRLEKGMTREQVHELLGEPNVPSNIGADVWENDTGDSVLILYGENGHLDRLGWNGNEEYRTTFEKFRDRLPLLALAAPPWRGVFIGKITK
jgi:SmpA / OmlA family